MHTFTHNTRAQINGQGAALLGELRAYCTAVATATCLVIVVVELLVPLLTPSLPPPLLAAPLKLLLFSVARIKELRMLFSRPKPKLPRFWILPVFFVLNSYFAAEGRCA
ncbi:hypothetical protein TSAR_015573 [Trichomalopsis sarcophagae]|uniref:Uncharacterized protein n=1 Tax=Trichomalopsis sarcophagae TaxID=543379 RepID=A0A232EV64_9HYME|nr:hypothetical protein TSAR_015573 [Trichomalopsis sarcophagae]